MSARRQITRERHSPWLLQSRCRILQETNTMLFEFVPEGYLIRHAETGQTVEFSTTAPSPYEGYTENLIYAGPMSYFTLTKEALIHTITQEEIPTGEAPLSSFSEASQEMHALLIQEAQQSSESDAAVEPQTAQMGMCGAVVAEPQTAASTVVYVPNNTMGLKISRMTTGEKMGHMSGGVCGYIAAGLLLYWFDECNQQDAVINDFAYFASDHSGFNGSNLTRLLRSYGKSSETYPSNPITIIDPDEQALDEIFEKYGTEYNLKFDISIDYPDSGYGITEKLRNKNVPVLAFGRLYDYSAGSGYGDHVALAYGYDEEYVKAHYGWAGYSNVNLKYIALAGTLTINSITVNPSTNE